MSSAASMMYAAVVGMPMPRMIAAAIVMKRASSRLVPEMPTRKLVNRMASPVCSTTPDHYARRGGGHRHGHRLLRPVARGASIPFRSVMRLSWRTQDSTITDAAEMIAA